MRRRQGRGGGQWENGGTALMDTGGSIRGERSAMGGSGEGGKEGEGCGLPVRTGDQGGCNTCTWHGQCIRYPTNA